MPSYDRWFRKYMSLARIRREKNVIASNYQGVAPDGSSGSEMISILKFIEVLLSESMMVGDPPEPIVMDA